MDRPFIIAALIAASSVGLAGQQPAPPTAPPAPPPSEAQVTRLLQRMLGTWKINREKSKDSAGPLPTTGTVTYAPAPETLGVLYSSRSVFADGTERNEKGLEPQILDGKEHQAATPNTIIIRRPLDEFTLEGIGKVKLVGNPPGTGVYFRNTQVFSPDGKSFTITVRYYNEQGHEVVARVTVYDKVR